MENHPKYGMLRAHQAEAATAATKIATGVLGRGRTIVLAHVTPGGGKTIMSACFADVLLDDDCCDLVVQVVPNGALRTQTQQSFTNPQRGLKRALSTQIRKLEQGQLYERCGYVVTYQALQNKKTREALLRLMRGKRVVVTLDEPHHLADRALDAASLRDLDALDGGDPTDRDGKAWLEWVKPIVDAASVVLLMTGTLNRHDKQRIPFVRYDANKMPIVDISYDRRAALDEQAVLPIEFEMQDAHALWKRYGKIYGARLAEATTKAKQRDGLNTALRMPEYIGGVIRAGVEHWRKTQAANGHYGRMLVIMRDIKSAKLALDVLKTEMGVDAVIATSDEKEAQKTIAAFKAGKHDALVTVGMAYEGLDILDLTHVVFLHRTRSTTWCSQAVERGARFDPTSKLSWDQQRCYVFCPDDQAMRTFVEDIRAKQAQAFKDRAGRLAGGIGRRPLGSGVQPISAEGLDTSWMSDDGTIVRGRDAEFALRARSVFPFLSHLPAHHLVEVGRRIHADGAAAE